MYGRAAIRLDRSDVQARPVDRPAAPRLPRPDPRAGLHRLAVLGGPAAGGREHDRRPGGRRRVPHRQGSGRPASKARVDRLLHLRPRRRGHCLGAVARPAGEPCAGRQPRGRGRSCHGPCSGRLAQDPRRRRSTARRRLEADGKDDHRLAYRPAAGHCRPGRHRRRRRPAGRRLRPSHRLVGAQGEARRALAEAGEPRSARRRE